MGYRRLKSDPRVAAAVIELLIRGAGRARSGHVDATAELQAWVGHRNRKQAARVALGNQLLANLDLVVKVIDGDTVDVRLQAADRHDGKDAVAVRRL